VDGPMIGSQQILPYPRRSPTTGGRIRTGTSVPV